MPSIKRRHREQRTGSGRRLSDDQHSFLVRGFTLFRKSGLQRTSSPMVPCPSPFASDSDARTAWQRHRAELLAEHNPGERPSAFWRFDVGLKVPPSSWVEEIALLIEHGLMTGEEQIAVESLRAVLDPQQSPGFNSAFESEAGTRAASLSSAVLHQLAQEFTFVCAWHQRRGRPGLAETYRRRALCVRSMISQSEVATDDH